MAMKLGDLRHELASRNLPTAGLKRDLAFRLASIDDAHDCNPSNFNPRRTSASSSMNSDKEGMPAKTEHHNIGNTKVREKVLKQALPSPIELSLPSVHNNHHHHHGDNDRRKSNSARFSVGFAKAVLPILLMIFLFCILRLFYSAEDKEYYSRSIANGYDHLSEKIKQLSKFHEVVILNLLRLYTRNSNILELFKRG